MRMRMRMRMRMESVFSKTLSFLLCITLFPTIHLEVEAQQCSPSSQLRGTDPPPGKCNTENDSECCVEGQMYDVYECSPPVNGQTSARLTLNSFESGGDGGGESSCDGQFHSNNELIVALSTGWFDNGSRCNKNIIIKGNGRNVTAKVVDECDSTRGCDADHAYQPPCGANVVDASSAVWTALEVSNDSWGDLDITWSDA